MSKTVVDERVVSMQFDNRHFEKNVQTSMSTLDKLKAKLNLSGASKGLEDVNAAAKKVDMSPLSKGVETVRVKFSALQTMAVTALANITNSAVNAGKRIASALTIEPVRTGFNEYELKMNSIQTIMASTGENLDTVNKYLNELNEYSDKTIYSFQDMTQNIGKFTNAGVKLEDAVLAMKGISNEAAVSGANANEASRAMYNFAQALSVGYIQRIDWKSIELANMATVEFKDQLLQSAIAAGTVKKNAEGMYTTLAHPDKAYKAAAMFTETLDDQWLTTEVLINTLKDYANEETTIGKKATKAATEVKTFTQMLDTLKESAQSGWAKTWELIFGDFEEGKTLWTKIGNVIGGVIDKMSNVRNALVADVMSSPWDKLVKKINEAGISTSDFQKALAKTAKKHNKDLDKMIDKEGSLEKVISKGLISKEILIETISDYADGMEKSSKSTKVSTDKLKYFQKVVNEVWRGDYKNGQERIEALTKAGYDYATVQDLVNKTVDGHKLTLADLSDAQLENVGYTKKQIKTIRELADEAKKSGTPLNELLDDLSRPSGKVLLLETGKNLLEAITKLLTPIKEAWKNTFGGNASNTVYNLLENVRDLSEALIISEDSAANFQRIFEGLFAGFQLANSVIGGGLVAVLRILSAVLSLFGTNLLEIGAQVADYIVMFRDWINENTVFINQYDKIAKVIKAIIDGVSRCVNAFLKLEIVQDVIKGFTKVLSKLFGSLGSGLNGFSVDGIIDVINSMFDSLETWIKGIDKAENVGLYIVQGLAKGLWAGAKWVFEAITTLGTSIIDIFTGIFKIESPSKVFFALGGFIIAGLLAGLNDRGIGVGEFFKNMLSDVGGFIIDFTSKIFTYIKQLEIGDMIAIAITAGIALAIKKTLTILNNFSEGVKGFGKMCSSVSKVGDALADRIKPQKSKFKVVCDAILELAIAIGILAGSIALLAQLDILSAWNAVGIIAVLVGVMLTFAILVTKFCGPTEVQIEKLAISMIAMGVSLWLMSVVIKKIATLSWEEWAKGIGGIVILLGAFTGIFAATKLLGNGANVFGKTILKITAAMLLMLIVVKYAGKMSPEQFERGTLAITAFSGIILVLMAASRLLNSSRNIDKIGGTIIKISFAMMLLLAVAKLAGNMSQKEFSRGVSAIVTFTAIVVALMAFSKLVTGSRNIDKIGGMMLKIAGAMMIMVLVAKIASTMSPEELAQGVVAITAFGAVVVGLMAAIKYLGTSKQLKDLAGTLLMMSVAIAILGTIAMILGLIPVKNLVKGVAVVAALGGVMAGLIAVTKFAKACKTELIILTSAIGVMALAMVALSFIDTTKLQAAAGALSLVTGAFAVMIVATKKAKKCKDELLVMAVTIITLGAVLYTLGSLNPEASLQSALALSTLLIAISSSLMMLDTIGGVSKSAMQSLLIVSLIVTGLAVVLGGMSALGVEASISTAIALGILLTVMAATLLILDQIKSVSLGAIGAMALLGLVVAELAVVLGFMSAFNVSPSLETATALSVLLITMATILPILALVGTLGVAAIIGVGVMAVLIAAVGGLLIGIGALVDSFPELETFLDKGMPVLEKIGFALGSFFGNIVGGLLSGISSGLPAIGAELSAFMVAAKPFIDGAKSIDAKCMDGVKSLAEVILILTGASILEGLTSWLTGGTSIAMFASELPLLGVGISGFATAVAGVDPSVVKAAADAAKALAQMTSEIPNEGGVVGWFAGENSITKFASELPVLGAGLNEFSNSIPDVKPSRMKAVAEAATALALMTSEIPNEGGVVGWFAGENSISKFGEELPKLGAGLNEFSNAIPDVKPSRVKAAAAAATELALMCGEIPNEGGVAAWFAGENSISKFAGELPKLGAGLNEFSNAIPDVKPDKVKAATDAAKELALMCGEIPNEGGVAAWFAGENSISKFGEELPKLGAGLQGFSTAITGITPSTVTAAAEAAKSIAEMTGEIPNEGGVVAWFTGDNSITEFADELPKLGKGLKKFSDSLSGITPENIKAAAQAGKDLAKMADTAPEETEHIKTFGSNLKSFGSGLAGFYTNMKTVVTTDGLITSVKTALDGISSFIKTINVEKTNNVVKAINGMVKMAKGMADVKSNSADGFTAALNTLGEAEADKFVKHFTGITDEMFKAGETAIVKFTEGVESKASKGEIGSAATTVLTYFTTGLKGSNSNKQNKYYSVGTYVVTGFCNGITDKGSLQKAYNAGVKLGNRAEQGARDALDEHSPSRVFYGIGEYACLGFVNALEVGTKQANEAGSMLGKASIKGINNAISKVADYVDSGMDSQPTIRPVLDLSNVESGVGAINGMFAGRRTLSVNTGSINGVAVAMANRQNGNNEVVSGIKALRKDIANMPRNQYNINGITYDDGSNISSAVESLVRAARIEGRT